MSYKPSIPTSIDEARERLIRVQSGLAAVAKELENPTRHSRITGLELSPEEFSVLQLRAVQAQRHMQVEEARCLAYIRRYEQELHAEERADARRMQHELELFRIKERAAEREAERIARQDRHAAQVEAARIAREERERLAQEERAVQIAASRIAKQQRLAQRDADRAVEPEEARIEREKQAQERQSYAARNAAHRAYLQRLADAGEPIESLDPENLLRHACRLLMKLKTQGRVGYDHQENALLNIIQQYPLILPDSLPVATTNE